MSPTPPGSWADSSGQPLAWHEVRLRSRDGTLRDAVLTMRSIGPDDDSGTGSPAQGPGKGATGGLMLMVTDVTLLKQVERALREKESLLRSFYQSSCNGDGRHRAGRRRRADRLGQRADRPALRAGAGRGGREDGQGAGDAARSALGLARASPPLPGHRPARAIRGAGRLAAGPEWVAATLSAMDSPGTGGDLCSFLIEDITERKRTEEDLRVAKELAEAASRAKDRFLAVLSHELRTPLTPVMIAVSSLIESGPDPAILPELEMIRRNIELESRLIDDLLDLSRIARGRLRLDLEAVDMHQALRRAVEICRDETFVAGLEVDHRADGPGVSRRGRPCADHADRLEPRAQRRQVHPDGRTVDHPHFEPDERGSRPRPAPRRGRLRR